MIFKQSKNEKRNIFGDFQTLCHDGHDYILWFLPVKNPRFFENISQVDVCIQEIGIQGDGLFKMMNSQPNFALGIEHASQVTPGDGKVWSGFNCFQVASL